MSKLLYVEDSKFFANIVKERVEKLLGIDVVICPNMATAREAIRTMRDEIFLAVLDLTLSDASDSEIVELVKSHAIPSIVFTGSFDEELREKIFNLDVIDYITKDSPSSLDYLVSLVKRINNNRQLTALVVDDSSVARKWTAGSLRQNLFRVIEAANGKEALRALENNTHKTDNQISLVITDYHMPEMDGFELIREIRKKWGKESMAIIGVSSEGSNLLSAKFIKAGANDFLKKPYLPEEFLCRISQNMDNLEQLHALREAATKDYLTGMYNRRFFFEMSYPIYANAKRQKFDLVVAMLDVDHFKSVNDTYGHDMGDEVLKKIAVVLSEMVRETDIIARFGGEEYCLVAPAMTKEDAAKYFEKVRQRISELEFETSDGSFSITVSFGVCIDLHESLEEMINSADELLYVAKESGRNRVEIG